MLASAPPNILRSGVVPRSQVASNEVPSRMSDSSGAIRQNSADGKLSG